MKQLEKILLKRQQDVNEKLQLVQAGGDVYGLTRTTILSKYWHKKNPGAARHLLGFPSWKEFVYKMHALFGVLSQKMVSNRKHKVTLFKQYVMLFLCIHTVIHA